MLHARALLYTRTPPLTLHLQRVSITTAKHPSHQAAPQPHSCCCCCCCCCCMLTTIIISQMTCHAGGLLYRWLAALPRTSEKNKTKPHFCYFWTHFCYWVHPYSGEPTQIFRDANRYILVQRSSLLGVGASPRSHLPLLGTVRVESRPKCRVINIIDQIGQIRNTVRNSGQGTCHRLRL